MLEISIDLDHNALIENFNFIMIHLRADLVSGDIMQSMRILVLQEVLLWFILRTCKKRLMNIMHPFEGN